tara:strand:- start:54649 stop:59295 length:4647 start_codon:yes stop_codon:yes gene_type:complete
MKPTINIIILDDNIDDLELILLELGKGEYEFIYKHCADKSSFESSLASFSPDIILSDHNLSGYTSMEALITAKKYYPLTPFLLVSGFIDEDEAIKMIVEKGVSDYILKDNLSRLNIAVSREIKNYRLKTDLDSKNKELQLLSMVAKQAHNGVIITDAEGRIEWVNKAFTNLTGYSLSESFGRKPGHFLQGKNTDPDAEHRISTKLKSLIPFQEEVLNYTKSGEEYWIKLDISPVFDSDGHPSKFIAIQEDITERKRTEILFSAVNDITTSLLDSDSLSDISRTITDKLASHFGFDDCYIYEQNNKTNTLTLLAVKDKKHRPQYSDFKPLRLKSDIGILGLVVKNKRSEIIPNTSEDERYVHRIQRGLSKITVPIIIDNDVIGLIDSEHKEVGFYTETHLKNLETLAGVIASKFKAAQERETKINAQNELIESQKQLLQITSNIDAAVLRYTLKPSGEGVLTYASPRTFNIYEINPEKALENDALIWDQILVEDKPHVDTTFEKAIKNKTSYEINFRIKTPSGKLKWIEANGTITYTDNGDIISDTVNKDVTERIIATKKIEENEAFLASITNNIPGVIIRYILYPDNHDEIDYVSDGCYDLFEIYPEDINQDSSNLWKLIFPEDAEKMIPAIQKSAENLSLWDFNYRIKTPSGKIKWMHASGTPERKDDKVIWYTVILDITKEKTAEQELIESNNQLLRAQQVGNIGNWSFDIESGEINWSDQVFVIYDRDFVSGNPSFEELATYHSSSDPGIIEINSAIEEGFFYDVDVLLITKKGEHKYIRTLGIPEKNSKGKVVGYSGIVQDITDKKLIELELIESEHRLKAITDNIEGLVQRFVLHKDGSSTITYISKGVENLHGINQALALEDISILWNQIHEDDKKDFQENVVLSAQEMSLWDHQWRINHPDGKIRWLRGTGTPKKDSKSGAIIWDTIVLDITKEKEFEISLKNTNNRLLEAQELSNIGDWSIDLVTGETNISPTIKKIYGVDRELTMDEGFSYYKEGYSRNRIEFVVNQAIEKGIPYTEELILVTAKGNERWVRAQGKGTFKDGKCTRISGTLQDITDQKKLEQQLQQSEFRLETAVKGANIGIWDLNLQTGINLVNKEWLDMLGYDFKNLALSFEFFNSILHPDDEKKIENELRKIEEGGKNNIDITIRLKGNDGEYRYILDRGSVTEFDENGKAIRIIGTNLDVTETITLQKELEEKEQRLSAAVKGADLGVWEFDVETQSNYVNEQYLDILGYSESEVELTFDWFMNIIHPDDIHLINKELVRITEGGENEIDLTLRMKAKDGSYKVLKDKGRVVEFGENRSIKRLIGTILDITEMVELQNTIQKSLDEKTVLLSEIHHRVKNNLAIISGLMDLQSLESTNDEVSDIVLGMGQRIKSIAGVHELLYNSENFSDVPLNKYVNNLLRNVNTSFLNKKDITFNISIDDSVSININQAVPVGLLLNELITNSFKYAFNDVEKPKIKFNITFESGKYSAEYVDNGPGIATDALEKSTTLGLTLIKTLLDQISADYKIDNESGFRLIFDFSPQRIGAHANKSDL